MTLQRIVYQFLVNIYVEESMSQDQEASKMQFYQSEINLVVIGLVLMINKAMAV